MEYKINSAGRNRTANKENSSKVFLSNFEASIDHYEQLDIIINLFPQMNDIPFDKTLSVYVEMKKIMFEASAADFEFLYHAKFHEALFSFLKGSKPIVFKYCSDILNQILKNKESSKFVSCILDISFVNFVFLAATYIPNPQENPPISPFQYSITGTYLNLMKILYHIVKRDVTIVNVFPASHFFQRLCIFYTKDICHRTSVLSLKLISYVLSQKNFYIQNDDFNPVLTISLDYFMGLLSSYTVNSNNSDSLISGYTVRREDFSMFCKVSIELVKRDINFFSDKISVLNLLRCFEYTNQINATSLLDLIIHILSINCQKEAIESIDWNCFDNLIRVFNAVKSEDTGFVIKLCILLDILTKFVVVSEQQLNDLFYFLTEGSIEMQKAAIRVICHICQLPNSIQKFDLHLNDIMFPKIKELVCSVDDNLLVLIIETLIKLISMPGINDNFKMMEQIRENDFVDTLKNISSSKDEMSDIISIFLNSLLPRDCACVE